jgi:hypothetical protein
VNQKIIDQKYHFISMFNPETGAYVPKRGADLLLPCATLDFDPYDYE